MINKTDEAVDTAFSRYGWDLCVASGVGISALYEFMAAEYGNIHNAIHKRWPEDLTPTLSPPTTTTTTTTTTTPAPQMTKEQVEAEIERLQQLRKSLL